MALQFIHVPHTHPRLYHPLHNWNPLLFPFSVFESPPRRSHIHRLLFHLQLQWLKHRFNNILHTNWASEWANQRMIFRNNKISANEWMRFECQMICKKRVFGLTISIAVLFFSSSAAAGQELLLLNHHVYSALIEYYYYYQLHYYHHDPPQLTTHSVNSGIIIISL